ncbi:MAG TPA: transglutaminase domain-containing protein [Puia sp.]|nr:transglutaminase domain-containing protein [Puia sp.]
MTRKKNCLFLAICCLLLHATSDAQDKKKEKLPVKFGKVTPEDFNITLTGPDSSAGAVVIADYGTSSFEGSSRGWFTLAFKHSRRIKILRRSGFEAATVTIPLYMAGSETEMVQALRASTYNLENGKVIETKLDDKSIFTDKISKNWVNRKFTFPALKEGAILEFTYTQTSPFLFQLQPWEFQGEYPCLWSEYQAEIPKFFEYATIGQGFVPFSINTSDSRLVTFHLTDPGGSGKDEHYTFDDEVVTHRWVMKNVPALKEEAFTTSLSNYTAKIEFQLSRYNFPGGYTKDIMGNWSGLSLGLLKDENFGADLDRNNSWMDDSLKMILRGAKTNLEKAQKIYAFVRDNFICTSHGSLYTSGALRSIYRNRNGNEADLNLLLTAMLHHEKIDADPVILSTRSHGFANPIYPVLSRFNYVICRVTIDSAWYYLDASEQWLGFGKLPERCYNGYARVISQDRPVGISLSADAMKELKITTVFITRDEKGKGLLGHLHTTPGFNEACGIRLKVKEKGQQELVKTIQNAYSGEIGFSNLELDSLKEPDEPLAVAYDLQITPDPSSNVFYFNPMLSEGYKENPFKATERVYPVEMGGAVDETYVMDMEIPEGYEIDELPKSAKVLYNDDEGFFEYLVEGNGDHIQFRTRLQLKKANFKPEDYDTLREFFGYIVKKESEQIVFKKKKA